MNVLKTKQKRVNLNEIRTTIEALKKGLNPDISTEIILDGIQNPFLTLENNDQITNSIVENAIVKSKLHPDYLTLASRILVSDLHHHTKTSFVEKMEDLYNNTISEPITANPIITKTELQIIKTHKKRIESAINYERDNNYDIFSLKMFKDTLLTKINNQFIERPQDLLMRVAIGIHKNNIEEAIKTYTFMSEGLFLHLPTQFLETRKRPTCTPHTITIENQSFSSLLNQLNSCAHLASLNREVNIAIHDIPSRVFISTMQLFNETVNYLNQEQDVSFQPFTMYLEPWHADVFNFLLLNKEHNSFNFHTSNLNSALWIPDLFMERVENNEDWTLMCPNECPGLSDISGKEFETLYKKYEAEGKGTKTIKAQELWFKILEAEIETGSIRLLFKDKINSKPTISSLVVKAPGETRVGLEHYIEEVNNHLVAVSLQKFVATQAFNFKKLYQIIYRIIVESSSILDYKVAESQEQEWQKTPVEIEVQGLTDLFLKLKIPFQSQEATQINKEIFETIQFAAITASKDLVKEKGICRSRENDANWQDYFQLDLSRIPKNNRWKWDELRKEVKKYGLYTPFLITLRPTSEIARVLENSEGFSPLSSFVKTHKLSTNSTLIVNRYLYDDLLNEGLWNPTLLQKIIHNQGAIQNIPEIPKHIKEIYKTAWEVPQENIIDRVSDREALGIQTQSMEIFIINPDFSKLTSIYFYCWRKGIDVGISHLRTKMDPDTMAFSINSNSSINDFEMKEI